MEIKIIKGNILDIPSEAIVNAANKDLLMGSGVCGAIFNAAGASMLQNECNKLNGCETGKAKLTIGCNLKQKYIIHAVGPIYYNYEPNEARNLLARAYLYIFELCRVNNIKSVSIPSISTGVYGYPKEDAVRVVRRVIEKTNLDFLDTIYFSCYDDETYNLYNKYFS